MVETERELLRHLLISTYDELKSRLTRRTGSSDLATEALHETWLRLDRVKHIKSVQRPKFYLYRMALNAAVDQRRAHTRWVDKASLETLLRADGDQADPERIASVRSEVVELERVLAELPGRRRAIFIAALLEELPYRDIAKRFGISLRSVEREMSRAFDHCAAHFKKVTEQGRTGASDNVFRMEAAPNRAANKGHDD